MDNLWRIKVILRWFDLVSRLKVNFFKIKVFWVNVEAIYLRNESNFLHCQLEIFSFIYVSITMDADPTKSSTFVSFQ